MRLKEAFAIREKEVIALVGGGGKTTLMFALAKELAAADSRVITTTTTKIEEPPSSWTEQLILAKDKEILTALIRDGISKHCHITVAKERMASGKLAGISPDITSVMTSLADYVIIEADGAARHSLKAPASYEPVIPEKTTLVIPVVGIDALGGKLDSVVFRFKIAARLLKASPAVTVTPEMIAELVTNKNGITKGAPAAARVVPFINKVDTAGGLEKGRVVARAILVKAHPDIEKVLLGQVRQPEPVVEIIGNNQ